MYNIRAFPVEALLPLSPSILKYNDTRTVPPLEAFCVNRHNNKLYL